MEQALPVVISCCVGIGLCVVYLLYLVARSILSRYWEKHPKQIEIDDNVLTIDLDSGKK